MPQKVEIVTLQQKNSKILHRPPKPVDFSKISSVELKRLAREMRRIMKAANGIGLSANQIGVDLRFFVAEPPVVQGRPKFYALANPEIVKASPEKKALEEGCLSIPQTYTLVERSEKITLSAFNLQGKKIKIKAWGLLARVFQHEIDHLNGILITDRGKVIKKKES